MDDIQVTESMTRSRDNILNIIETITTNPKPTYNIDGQKVEWGAYLGQLWAALEQINLKLAGYEDGEVRSQVYP